MKKKLAFLQSIGFPKAVAEMIVKNEDFGDDVDIDGTTSEVRTAIGESFKNDGEFLKPIKAAERKAILAGREKNLRKLAGDHLTDDEWNGLPENSRLDDGMKLVMDKLAAVKADPKKSPDDKDKEIAMRRRLAPGIRMYTGDDFNFAELIAGETNTLITVDGVLYAPVTVPHANTTEETR